jgi:hypothetical protein
MHACGRLRSHRQASYLAHVLSPRIISTPPPAERPARCAGAPPCPPSYDNTVIMSRIRTTARKAPSHPPPHAPHPVRQHAPQHLGARARAAAALPARRRRRVVSEPRLRMAGCCWGPRRRGGGGARAWRRRRRGAAARHRGVRGVVVEVERGGRRRGGAVLRAEPPVRFRAGEEAVLAHAFGVGLCFERGGASGGGGGGGGGAGRRDGLG